MCDKVTRAAGEAVRRERLMWNVVHDLFFRHNPHFIGPVETLSTHEIDPVTTLERCAPIGTIGGAFNLYECYGNGIAVGS